jgi:hypothetical protein
MSDHLDALQRAFSATPEPASTPHLGASALSETKRALDDARGQLTVLRKQPDLTSAHAKQLAACAQSLRRCAHSLERLAAGVEDHVTNGVSLWTGTAGHEQPVLL